MSVTNRTKALVALLAGILLIAIVGVPFADRVYLDQAAARGETTLRLAVSALHGHMQRYAPLPQILADREDIRKVASNPQDLAHRDSVNVYLKEINELIGSSDIYVLIRGGDTIAASNFDLPLTFIGENFEYRPYYLDAINGQIGRFFAVGTTTQKRGYYFSAPIRDGERVTGVLVVKVDLDPIERSWEGGEDEIIVYDPEGVIFMTSNSELLYASLLPLTPERVARTQQSRRYSNENVRELAVTRSISDGRTRMTDPIVGGSRNFLVQVASMPDAGWTVEVLVDTRAARNQAITTVTAIGLSLALAGLAAFVYLGYRSRLAERLELQRRTQEQLEQRVEERTAALAQVNRQLETEVGERRATEVQLRKTQSELVQAAKLAALGQMSAALSHEFNQPLTAVKTYADNGVKLIERKRLDQAKDNFDRISRLIGRMASISRHLRNFAREPNQSLGPVLLSEVVRDSIEIVTPRLKISQVALHVDIVPAGLAANAISIKLQQVLVNLITNAADAMDGMRDPTIEIVAREENGKVLLSVGDHGTGIAESQMERIFDPFFTTKGVGKGLGLGLSISYNIIKDFSGILRAENRPGGGAVFIIELEPAHSLAEAAE